MQKPGAAALHNLGGEQVQKMLAAKSKSAKSSTVETAENDRVFVPHYEVYANKKKVQYARPMESPPSVLPPSGSNQFWPSSGEGSSMSSVDNVRSETLTMQLVYFPQLLSYSQTPLINLARRVSVVFLTGVSEVSQVILH